MTTTRAETCGGCYGYGDGPGPCGCPCHTDLPNVPAGVGGLASAPPPAERLDTVAAPPAGTSTPAPVPVRADPRCQLRSTITTETIGDVVLVKSRGRVMMTVAPWESVFYVMGLHDGMHLEAAEWRATQ